MEMNDLPQCRKRTAQARGTSVFQSAASVLSPAAMWLSKVGIALVTAVLAAPALFAAEPPEAVLQRMKRWLEPDKASTRRLTMTVQSGTQVAVWKAGQARAALGGSNWVLTVLLEPKDLRGIALLIQERADQPANEWLYLPYLRRVRRVLPVDEFESFLSTEFTHSDLGFVNTRDRTVAVLTSVETPSGLSAVKIEEVPRDQRTFSRIVSWIAPDSGRPFKRECYDVGGKLWKVLTFDEVVPIDGVPTAERVRVGDVQSGFSSEYRVAQVRYGVTLPAALFDPARLAKAADSTVWKGAVARAP